MPQCLLGNVQIHAEVPILLLFFAFLFESSVTTNLIIYRTCYVTLGFNKSECALLGTNHTDNATATLEEKVQPHASIIIMSKSIAEGVIPPLLCFFLGSWSDKYGRKPILLVSFGGFVIAYGIMTVVSALPNASPWLLLLYIIPVCLTGGFAALFTTLLSYITDVTSLENRGIRMAIFEAVLTIGVLLGASSSSFALNAFGYTVIYLTCTICVLGAWLFILFLMPESVSNIPNEGKLRNLFKFSLLEETLQTTFKRRENHNRALLFCLISLMVIFMLGCFSDTVVIFLYLREKFHWSLERYTLYVAINNLTWIMGSVVGAYFLNKLLQVSEVFVIFLGLFTNLIAYLLQGLATTNWQIYAAGSSKFLGGAISPMARSLLTRLIPAEDTGKVFAVVTALETICGFIGSPVYTLIYNYTLVTFPGAFNFVTAGIFLLELFLIIAIIIIQRKRNQIVYIGLNNEEAIN